MGAAPRPPRRSRVLPFLGALAALAVAEAPAIAGVVAGGILVWAHAAGLQGILDGSDWQVYIASAEALWHPARRMEVGFNDWRGLLHPALVAGYGEQVGYVTAAAWISALAALAAVASAALLARSLAGAWEAGAAAILAALYPPLQAAAGWLNSYALQGAAIGAAIALGAAACRWPMAGWALLAGLAAALARTTDPRGTIAPIAAAILVLGTALALRPWRRAAVFALAFALGLGGPLWAADRLAERQAVHFLDLAQIVERQRQVQSGGVFETEAVATACRGLGSARPALHSPCAAAHRRANLAWLEAMAGFPTAVTLAFGLALLVPPAWGRRGLGVALVTFGLPLALTAVALSSIEHNVRYVVWLAVPLAALLPVAADRLAQAGGRLGVPAFLARLTAAGGLVAWCTLVWPVPARGVVHRPRPDDRAALAAWAARAIGPTDLLLDCGDGNLRELLLPRRIPLRDFPFPYTACREHATAPPEVAGTVWMLARPDEPAHPLGPLLDAAGWRRIACGPDGDAPPCREHALYATP